MPTEGASYISQLDAANPTGAAPKSEGDDQFRQLKTVLKTQFPNFGAAALSASNTQLDKVVTTVSINSGAPSAAITVNAAGDVGIATATPDVFGRGYGGAILGVSDAAAGQSAIVVNSFTGSAFLEMGVGGTRVMSLNASATEVGLGANAAVPLILSTSGTERARIDALGNTILVLTSSAPALATDSQLVFTLTSNTNLRISVRGLDGAIRTANITLS